MVQYKEKAADDNRLWLRFSCQWHVASSGYVSGANFVVGAVFLKLLTA